MCLTILLCGSLINFVRQTSLFSQTISSASRNGSHFNNFFLSPLQVCQHRLGVGDEPDGALHPGSQLADGHFQLRRRRQRHPAVRRTAAGDESGLFRPPPALRRLYLHSGQQVVRSRRSSPCRKGELADRLSAENVLTEKVLAESVLAEFLLAENVLAELK